MYSADDLKWGPLSCQWQTAFNKAEEDIIFQDLHNSQITQKKNPIISLLFIQKFVILKPVVFVLFLLCFKALFWLFPLRITREIHWSFCSLHICFPLFFDVVLLSTSVFQIWSTVATFYAELAGRFQPIRNEWTKD